MPPKSARALRTDAVVGALQQRFVDRLEAIGTGSRFAPTSWLRDGGRHGGGTRFGVADTPVFDRASINTSCVHYDDEPDKKLGSATALSAIVHPRHPRAPSVHVHVSFTEGKAQAGLPPPGAQGGGNKRDSPVRSAPGGSGFWRMMGDLNPSIPDPAATSAFRDGLRAAAPAEYDRASAQGDRYFFVPALDRHRGVAHFYLEGYATDDADADAALARTFGEAVIDRYAEILASALRSAAPPSDDERRQQLAYHTLYLFQVTTLDRGTTSGLMVHDQNDLGIMGSLPGRVDLGLLRSWGARVPAPQDQLVANLADVLVDRGDGTATVDDDAKRGLARAIRAHYQAHPEALALQAAGDAPPPTFAR